MLRSLDLGFDQLSAWVVGQPEAQLPEGLCLVVRAGVLQDSRDVGELGNGAGDELARQPALCVTDD
jgi:hypothetical protein